MGSRKCVTHIAPTARGLAIGSTVHRTKPREDTESFPPRGFVDFSKYHSLHNQERTGGAPVSGMRLVVQPADGEIPIHTEG
jgi:hypothetical protein